MSAAEERAAFWQETKHRMTRRLAGWDYRQRAIYMITVTLEDRRGEPLGKLAKNGESQNYIAPTPFGEAVLEALAEMPRIAPQVEIIAVQLMPDHIHFIVFVKALLARPLGSLVRGFKAGAAKRWKAYIAKNGESQGYIAKNGESQNCPSSVPGHSCAGVVLCLGIFAQVVLCLGIFAQVVLCLGIFAQVLNGPRAFKIPCFCTKGS